MCVWFCCCCWVLIKCIYMFCWVCVMCVSVCEMCVRCGWCCCLDSFWVTWRTRSERARIWMKMCFILKSMRCLRGCMKNIYYLWLSGMRVWWVCEGLGICWWIWWRRRSVCFDRAGSRICLWGWRWMRMRFVWCCIWRCVEWWMVWVMCEGGCVWWLKWCWRVIYSTSARRRRCKTWRFVILSRWCVIILRMSRNDLIWMLVNCLWCLLRYRRRCYDWRVGGNLIVLKKSTRVCEAARRGSACWFFVIMWVLILWVWFFWCVILYFWMLIFMLCLWWILLWCWMILRLTNCVGSCFRALNLTIFCARSLMRVEFNVYFLVLFLFCLIFLGFFKILFCMLMVLVCVKMIGLLFSTVWVVRSNLIGTSFRICYRVWMFFF